MKRILTCLLLIGAIGWPGKTILSFEKKPNWVKVHPVSQNYYIGIGVAAKSDSSRDYRQIARDNALSDLASQIKVNIASEVFRQVVEKSGVIEEDFKSRIRSSTKADLEGYELVDTWEDRNEYWVYYRLSRALYEKLRREKIEKAVRLSLDMVKKAKAHEKGNDVEKALLFYTQSIYPIEKYVNEPLQVSIDGRNAFLMNEIYASLQNMLGRIELQAINPNRQAKVGKGMRESLQVVATYAADDGGRVAIANLPLRFYFLRGAGELIQTARTDRQGKARSRVAKITATDKIQIVKAELDMSRFLKEENPSFVMREILNSLAMPSTRFVLNVAGLSAYVEAQELLFGRRVQVQHIEPALKNELSRRGFIFLETPGNADLMIKIEAEARQGSEIYGMYSAFANLTLSVVDMNTGDEIYKSSLHDVKGIDLTYKKAGLKALENAANRVNEKLIPEFIRQIQR